MLSLLPQLFFLAPLGYALTRGALAALLILGMREQWSRTAPVSVRLMIGIEGMLALSLATGFMTQAAAILVIVLFCLWLAMPRMRPYPPSTILLGVVMAATLIVGGAGIFAFDLPI